MRKLFLLSILFFPLVVSAQKKDYNLTVFSKDGTRMSFPINDVDSLKFNKNAVDVSNTECFSDCDNWYVNIENPVTSRYMNEVDYSDVLDDYSVTYINNYNKISTTYRKDEPRGVRLELKGGENQYVVLSFVPDFSLNNDTLKVNDGANSYIIYNLLPGKKYYYRIYSNNEKIKENHFYTIGQVRMMHLPSIYNVRDLGGWLTLDGGRIRYGLLYRGGEMTTAYNYIGKEPHEISSEDSLYMHDKMNIRLDMDLRDNNDLCKYDSIQGNELDFTPLGEDVEYFNEAVNYNMPYFSTFNNSCAKTFGRTFTHIINTLRKGNGVYFHCVKGADRTGMLSLLLEGLCGVSLADITKDFELTCFYKNKTRSQAYFGNDIDWLFTLDGETFQQKVRTYFMRAGVTAEELDDFVKIMVEY